MTKSSESALENHAESKSFLASALAWHGTVTPRVLHRVFIAAGYAGAVYFLSLFIPNFSIPITPFEYSGAVLALLLVMRVNAGHDRWWEARKLWGSIVNQSRNLATATLAYNKSGDETANRLAGWAAAWPYVMKNSLRSQKNITEVARFVGAAEVDWLSRKDHMPSQVGLKVARLLNQLRVNGMDNFAFQRAETERSALIDAIGACERIKSTRMPFVLAVKTRRFILLFLLLLPIALVDRVGILTPLVMALAAYPLFSLDEIGAELQNPFSERNLSHLPLDRICDTISSNIMNLILETQTEQSQEKAGHSPPMVPANRPLGSLTSIDRSGAPQSHKI